MLILPFGMLATSVATGAVCRKHIMGQYWDLGVTPCGTRPETRKGEKGAIRLPKILVLTCVTPARGCSVTISSAVTRQQSPLEPWSYTMRKAGFDFAAPSTT